MLIRWSVRELLHHPLRTSLAVAGVAVATAMLLDMLMLGTGLQRSFEELLASRGYELRAAPAGTLPLDTDDTLGGAGALRSSLQADPRVAGVAPVLGANLLARRASGTAGEATGPGGDGPTGGRGASGGAAATPDGDGAVPLFVLGVDPEEQGLYRILEGRGPASADDVLLSRDAAEALDAAPGDTLRLSAGDALGAPASPGRAVRVSGTAEFLYASRRERTAAMRLGALQSLSGRPDRASFFMVRLEPGADPDAVAADLAADHAGLEVASVAQLVERARERLSYFRQLALILGTVSLVVAGLLVGTVMAVSVSDRHGTIAALRAVGVSRRSVVLVVAGESLALCAVAGLLGLGLGSVTARWLESVLADFPGLPQAVRFFVLRPGDLAKGYAAVLGVGVAAALVPAWRAAGLEIAGTLHREEP